MRKFKVQALMQDWKGYKGWNTFCIRDSKTNCHIATVGDVDRRFQAEAEHLAYLLAASPQILDALELCYTRLFNYQAGMDEIRDPQATKDLNAEALAKAKATLDLVPLWIKSAIK